MVERVAILLALLVGAAGLSLVVRLWVAGRDRRLRQLMPDRFWSALDARPDGRATVVVFSSPSCVACRLSQEPAVARVVSEFDGQLRVIRVDISARPSVARAFKILTAPSTAVLGPDGRLRGVNHGFAPADVLLGQVRSGGDARASRPLAPPQSQPAPAAPLSAVHR